MGTIFTQGLVNPRGHELLAYDDIRSTAQPTAYISAVSRPTLVLGSTQREEHVIARDNECDIRRRRGGGGVVLLRPGDAWVDFWIPASDSRHDLDARRAAMRIGAWWLDVLQRLSNAPFTIHSTIGPESALERAACFGAVGFGEITVAKRKLMGLTQWRVREGNFVSTLVPVRDSLELLTALVDPPLGWNTALAHPSLSSLNLSRDDLTVQLLDDSGPWAVQHTSV